MSLPGPVALVIVNFRLGVPSKYLGIQIAPGPTLSLVSGISQKRVHVGHTDSLRGVIP